MHNNSKLVFWKSSRFYNHSMGGSQNSSSMFSTFEWGPELKGFSHLLLPRILSPWDRGSISLDIFFQLSRIDIICKMV